MYYVLGDGGTRYGPADLATLKAWVQEGRVLPQTMLEQVVDGQVIPAAQVPDLFNGPTPQTAYHAPTVNQPAQHAPYQQPGPYQSHPGPHGAPTNPPANNYQNANYPRPGSSGTSSQMTAGWVCFGIACLLCFIPCCNLASIVLHIIAITIGVKEKNQGNPQGSTLATVAGILLGLDIAAILFFIIMSAMSN